MTSEQRREMETYLYSLEFLINMLILKLRIRIRYTIKTHKISFNAFKTSSMIFYTNVNNPFFSFSLILKIIFIQYMQILFIYHLNYEHLKYFIIMKRSIPF